MTALLPHADSSVEFTRWRQCGSHQTHPSWHLNRTARYWFWPRAELLWVYRPLDTSKHVLDQLKIAPSCVWSGPLANTRFLWLTPVHTRNGISIGSAVFAQTPAEFPDALQWVTPFPSQNCPVAWEIWTPSSTYFFGSIQVQTPDSWSWQTERPRFSICNNRPHLRSTASQPNNTYINVWIQCFHATLVEVGSGLEMKTVSSSTPVFACKKFRCCTISIRHTACFIAMQHIIDNADTW